MMATRSTAKVAREAEEIPARQRILDAAFSAFMERGFAETSTLEIATRARVSKRELYALVGSKQEMLMACIAARAQRLQMPADLPEPRDREALARARSRVGPRPEAALLAHAARPPGQYAQRVVVFKDGKSRKDYEVEEQRDAAEELKHMPAIEEDDDEE